MFLFLCIYLHCLFFPFFIAHSFWEYIIYFFFYKSIKIIRSTRF